SSPRAATEITHRSRSARCGTGSIISRRATGWWWSSRALACASSSQPSPSVSDGLRATLFPRPGGHPIPVVSGGRPLEAAIVVGIDPLTLLASQAIAPIDVDELEIAGALHRRPLSVVKCLTSDLRVPADAEIVIEGRLLPGVRAPEGPFGEFPQ